MKGEKTILTLKFMLKYLALIILFRVWCLPYLFYEIRKSELEKSNKDPKKDKLLKNLAVLSVFAVVCVLAMVVWEFLYLFGVIGSSPYGY